MFSSLSNIVFIDKIYFYLFFLLPFILYFYYKKQKKGIKFKFLDDLKEVFKFNSFKYYIKFFVFFFIFVFFILIFANPNKLNITEKVKKNGIDIVLVLDVSDSMRAEDLKPNRLESAKKVISNFIKKQNGNRVGLIVFSGKPFTSIPLTFDYNILEETVKRLKTDYINKQNLAGTAIGDAILIAKNLFSKDEKSRQKVIILLTDGDANVGVNPKIAAVSAKDENIKIYTIGIGSEKGGYLTYNIGPFQEKAKIAPLNDKSLKEISKITSSEYFRARDDKTLENIFSSLESLNKSDIESEIKKNYKSYYGFFVYFLIFLIFCFIILEMGIKLIFKKSKKVLKTYNF